MSKIQYLPVDEEDSSAVERVAGLPLVRSLVQGVGSVYGEARTRYPLLGFMGDLSSLGLRFLQLTASERTAPLRDRLQPEIQALNHYACMGLDEMEKNFPALNQSAEEVLSHLKDGLFLTLDDLQVRVTEEVDGMLEKGEQLVDVIWDLLIALQNSPAGRAVTSGLDDVLTRTEEAVALYLPIPPTLRNEFEARAQLYEDDDDDEEPGTWTRVRCLLLSLTLQLYHRALKLREQLQHAIQPLGVAADTVGLTRMVETVVSLLQNLMAFYLAQVKRMAGLRAVALERLSGLVQSLVRLPPVAQLQAQLQALPAQLGEVATGLQELSTLLIQLLINTTPLYNMLEEPTEQELLEYLNQEEPCEEVTARRDCSSTSSLFLKTMDARPRRRRSFYARNRRSSTSYAPDSSSSLFSTTTTPNTTPNTTSTTSSSQGSNVTPTSTPTTISTPTQAPLPANGRKGSMKRGSQPEIDTLRKASLKPEPDTPRKASLKRGSQSELVDTPRKGSLKPGSQPEMDTPRKASLKRGSQPELVDTPHKASLKPASQSEVETPRKASLKPGSQTEMDTPRKGSLKPEMDTPRKGSLKPEVDTPRKGSLKPASQPEMDTPRKGSLKLQLVDTPTVLPPSNMGRRRSSAAEILLTPIIQLVSQSQRALEYFSSNLNQEEDDMEERKEE
ncbi:perilipin 6, partial [Engraulis encrasicolus]|uniref:perilipin 6 n=1 Tax=Engraulis encrasicolus TaxID=184585 RepID=UPI002FD38D2B